MAPPSLPGFYWDASRNRYFKIEENHLATSAPQYSSQRVKKLQEEAKERQLEQKHALMEKEQKFPRSSLLSESNLSGLRIREEHGAAASRAAIRESRTQLSGSSSSFTKLKGFDNGSSGCFDWNSISENFLYARISPDFVGCCEVKHYWNIESKERIPGGGIILCKDSLSSMTAVSCSKYGIFAVATLAESNSRGSVEIHPLSVVSRNATDMNTSYVSEFQVQVNDESAWALAANPEYPLFACGLTEKFYILRPREISRDSETTHKKVKSDVLSVEWLNSSVVACGQRNGQILLYDTRSDGTSARLRHPGMAGKIRCLDESRLVACGPKNALCMYDLRMPRDDVSIRRLMGSHKKRSVMITKPTVRYPYKNSTENPGLAICPELGLLAAGSDDAPVEIWSLHHGHRLHKMQIPTSEDQNSVDFSSMAAHLKFADSDTGYSLYASYNGNMYKTGVPIQRTHSLPESES